MTAAITGGLLALCPLRVEARAVRSGAPAVTVVRTGAGTRRAALRCDRLGPVAPSAVAVVGVAGALGGQLHPGDLVVADRVIGPGGATVAVLPSARPVAGALRRAGLVVTVGPVLTSDRLLRGSATRRDAADATGAVAVDMESAALVVRPWRAPICVVRAVADTPGRELLSPATVWGGRAALRSLRSAAGVLAAWADAGAEVQRIPLAATSEVR